MRSKYQCSIVTFHNAVNYGAVLQAYALKRINSRFVPTFIQTHINSQIENNYSANPFLGDTLGALLYRGSKCIPRVIRNHRFRSFIKNYLTNDKPSSEHIFYIAGSDQVWNPDCTEFDKFYFLDFVKENRLKNSYSASFGVESLPNEQKEEYRRLLSGYHSISVREQAGQQIIEDLLGREVPVTLDPTLLLHGEEWASTFCTDSGKSSYILVYVFEITESLCLLINSLSEQLDLPVVILMPDRSIRKRCPIRRATIKTTVSPEAWVNYFYHATFIVTNSFHGTAFSINFNKPFLVELLPPPAKVNSRLTNILSSFGLSDRLFQGDLSKLDTEIDYEPVNRLLALERQRSLEYLEGISRSYDE